MASKPILLTDCVIQGDPLEGSKLFALAKEAKKQVICTFQWYRVGDDKSEVLIRGATWAYYHITKEDVGNRLKVVGVPLFRTADGVQEGKEVFSITEKIIPCTCAAAPMDVQGKPPLQSWIESVFGRTNSAHADFSRRTGRDRPVPPQVPEAAEMPPSHFSLNSNTEEPELVSARELSDGEDDDASDSTIIAQDMSLALPAHLSAPDAAEAALAAGEALAAEATLAPENAHDRSHPEGSEDDTRCNLETWDENLKQPQPCQPGPGAAGASGTHSSALSSAPSTRDAGTPAGTPPPCALSTPSAQSVSDPRSAPLEPTAAYCVGLDKLSRAAQGCDSSAEPSGTLSAEISVSATTPHRPSAPEPPKRSASLGESAPTLDADAGSLEPVAAGPQAGPPGLKLQQAERGGSAKHAQQQQAEHVTSEHVAAAVPTSPPAEKSPYPRSSSVSGATTAELAGSKVKAGGEQGEARWAELEGMREGSDEEEGSPAGAAAEAAKRSSARSKGWVCVECCGRRWRGGEVACAVLLGAAGVAAWLCWIALPAQRLGSGGGGAGRAGAMAAVVLWTLFTAALLGVAAWRGLAQTEARERVERGGSAKLREYSKSLVASFREGAARSRSGGLGFMAGGGEQERQRQRSVDSGPVHSDSSGMPGV